MADSIRIAGIMRESIVDGPGIRFAVFCQGCPHDCPGCHNPETHDFAGGTEVSVERLLQEFDKAWNKEQDSENVSCHGKHCKKVCRNEPVLSRKH